jgi:hypothetical protein
MRDIAVYKKNYMVENLELRSVTRRTLGGQKIKVPRNRPEGPEGGRGVEV